MRNWGKKRKSEPIPLGDLVTTVLGHRDGAVAVSIVTAVWEREIAPRIVKNASPTRLRDGVLSIETTTSAWAQELMLMSPAILAKLRARLPAFQIDSLRAKSGPFHKRAPIDTSRPPKIAPIPEHELPGDLRSELARVDDEPLRDTIARAARQSLAHRRSG